VNYLYAVDFRQREGFVHYPVYLVLAVYIILFRQMYAVIASLNQFRLFVLMIGACTVLHPAVSEIGAVVGEELAL
jgi:hypothetical protein